MFGCPELKAKKYTLFFFGGGGGKGEEGGLGFL